MKQTIRKLKLKHEPKRKPVNRKKNPSERRIRPGYPDRISQVPVRLKRGAIVLVNEVSSENGVRYPDQARVVRRRCRLAVQPKNGTYLPAGYLPPDRVGDMCNLCYFI